jgi:hypothetical protein
MHQRPSVQPSMISSSQTLYQGCQVAFLTQHGKQDLIFAPLEAALGCQLVHTDGYDTDQLGTFTRDVDRPGSQIDAAREKAKIGMKLTGARVGMGSEGTFGADPVGGFIPWNTEVLLWVDLDSGIEVTGFAQGPSKSLHKAVKTLEELTCFAAEANFPEHHLALRPGHEDHPEIMKGIHDWKSLVEAFDLLKAKSENGAVFVENDLRAFCNPTRQVIIRKAADDLIEKLLSTCPTCAAPGFWVTNLVPGLPCKLCTHPTRLPIGKVWSCKVCGKQDHRVSNFGEFADPNRCDFCNP